MRGGRGGEGGVEEEEVKKKRGRTRTRGEKAKGDRVEQEGTWNALRMDGFGGNVEPWFLRRKDEDGEVSR